MHTGNMLPIKKSGSAACLGRDHRQRLRHVRQAGIGEQHALGDLGGERHHPLAQCGEHDRRQCADAVIGFDLFDKGAGIGERLSHGDAEPLMHRAMGDADAKAKPPARDLVDIGRTRREFFGRLRIDWRDRGAERDPFGSECQACALRHVAEPARHIDARKAAPLDLARDIERSPPPPRHGNEADRRKRFGHRRCSVAVGRARQQPMRPWTLVQSAGCSKLVLMLANPYSG